MNCRKSIICNEVIECYKYFFVTSTSLVNSLCNFVPFHIVCTKVQKPQTFCNYRFPVNQSIIYLSIYWSSINQSIYLSSIYHLYIYLSSIHHLSTINLSSIYHLSIIYLSSTYHLSIIYLSSIYLSINYLPIYLPSFYHHSIIYLLIL